MDLLEILRCPACASELRWERRGDEPAGEEYGVLSCAHHAYPVVAGIPVMVRDHMEELVAAVREGRNETALLLALTSGRKSGLQKSIECSRVLKRVPGLRARLGRRFDEGRFERARAIRDAAVAGKSFRELLQAAFGYAGKSDTVDYFFYKFGQPRHLAAMAWVPALTLAEGPILDFGCGPGHLVWSLTENGAAGRMVGADLYFKSLYLARQLAGRRARFVCCNADHGLPFKSSAFGAIVSSDAFHFLGYPAPCLRELQRSLRRGGLLALLSLPNPEARCPELRTGTPPELRRWPALMGEMPFRLLANRDLCRKYLERQGPDARRSVPPAEWEETPVVSVVASHDEREWFREYGPLREWPHAAGELAINPLYRPAPRNGGDEVYRLQFPSEFYRSENGVAETYLPAEVRMLPGRVTAEQREAWVANCVLVAAPSNYGAAGFSTETYGETAREPSASMVGSYR